MKKWLTDESIKALKFSLFLIHDATYDNIHPSLTQQTGKHETGPFFPFTINLSTPISIAIHPQ
ncbi:hypothetical protein BH09BAC4_BH09BAC4_52460 [soil metagenome]